MNKFVSIYIYTFILMLISANVYASGYRFNEQSINGTALNSAYVAGAYGADSVYYNPANMGLGKDWDKWEFEFAGTLIWVPSFDFHTEGRDKGMKMNICFIPGSCTESEIAPAGPAEVEGHANDTWQPVPKFFFKTKALQMNDDFKMNAGVSFTTPSGLGMDWDGEGGGFLDDVFIAMLEFNPAVSFTYKDFLSFGVGIRALYAFGDFNNTLYVPISYNAFGFADVSGTTKVEQTSDAKDWGFGHNLALSIKPHPTTTISLTYRSKVHWDMKGSLSAKSHINFGTLSGYALMDADLNLSADLPASYNIAIAQDLGRFRLEFVYERTLYSDADVFKFGYANQTFNTDNIPEGLQSLIDPEQMMNAADYDAVAYGQGWRDCSAYRFGVHYFGKTYTIMGSFAYDETPAIQGKFGIPDASAYNFGLGFRKRFMQEKLDLGIAYSISLKDNRSSFIQSYDGWGQMQLLTLGAKYLW